MAAADREKVKEKVQAALPDAAPDQVEDYIDQAEEYFSSKTGRRTIPDRALHIWIDLAVKIGKSGGLQEGGQQAVSSIKRGDTTVEYSSGSGTSLSSLDARIVLFKVAKIR